MADYVGLETSGHVLLEDGSGLLLETSSPDAVVVVSQAGLSLGASTVSVLADVNATIAPLQAGLRLSSTAPVLLVSTTLATPAAALKLGGTVPEYAAQTFIFVTPPCLELPLLHYGGNGSVPDAGTVDDGYRIPGVVLEYWYRLGETGPWPTGAMSTPNFAADSSGFSRHLTAINRNTDGTGVMFSDPSNPTLPNRHIVGPLTGADEDGAIQFNWNEFQWIVWGEQVVLMSTAPWIEAFLRSGGLPVGTGSTFSAWVAFMPVGGPGTDNFEPDAADGSDMETRPLISTWSRSFGVGNYGVRVGFQPADGHLWYMVGSLNEQTPFYWQSPSGFLPGEWHHFVSSIEKLASDSYQRRIYLDGDKLLDLTGTLVEIGGGSASGAGLSIGGGKEDDIRWAHGRGKVDEVAYWSGALSEAQILGVYHAGRGGAPEPDAVECVELDLVPAGCR